MYYQPWYEKKNTTCVCVLNSHDGLNWFRPHLDLFEGHEISENNIVIEHVKDGCFVFYDTNPACPAKEKYKAIGLADTVQPDGKTKASLCCYTSPDGYHFSLSHSMTRYGTFDSLNTAFWDGEKYVCYLRSLHNSSEAVRQSTLEFNEIYRQIKDWKQVIRDIRVMYSQDFKSWTVPEPIRFEDGHDLPLYTNNIQKYDRAPVYIGFPVRYCERPVWTANMEQMPSYEIKRNATLRIEPRTGRVSTDCIFICSHDGKNWYRYGEAFLTPGYEEEHNWIYGDCYLAYNMIDSGSEYYSLYTIDRHFSFGCPRPLNRYEIRKDGFACTMAGGEEAVLVTKPILFSGESLHLNFSTSAYGYIYVSILDQAGEKVLADESVEVFGDNIDRKVIFRKDFTLSSLVHTPVRLKFRMRDAKLFSMQFE